MTRKKKNGTPRDPTPDRRDEPENASPDEPRREGAPPEAEDGLAAGQRECDELRDRLQRLAAEFSNYQKRSERRVRDERLEAVGDLVLDLLPAIDNFERAIEAAEATPDFDAFLEGVRLVHDQLLAALKKHGVTPIHTAERAFDPEHHEAVAHLPSDEHPNGHVMEEMLRGYRFGERTLRASRVAVSSGKPQAETPDRTAADETGAGNPAATDSE